MKISISWIKQNNLEHLSLLLFFQVLAAIFVKTLGGITGAITSSLLLTSWRAFSARSAMTKIARDTGEAGGSLTIRYMSHCFSLMCVPKLSEYQQLRKFQAFNNSLAMAQVFLDAST